MISNTKQYDVFISYSSRDSKLANALCHFLETNDLRCWMAPRDISAGKDYAETIIKAIQLSRIMVVVFSSSTNNSKHVRNEVEGAFNHQLVIIPFKTEDFIPAKSFEYFFSSTHWLDAVNGNAEDYFEELYENCAALLRKKPLERKYLSKESNAHPKKIERKYIILIVVVITVIIAIIFYNYNGSKKKDDVNTAVNAKLKINLPDTMGKKPGIYMKKEEQPKQVFTQKYKIKNTAIVSVSIKPIVDLSFLDGTRYIQSTTTYNLTFTVISGNTLQFSGYICGYDVNGKLKFLNNMKFEVSEGNISGNISFLENNTRVKGNVIIKESGLPCAVDLTRVNERQ